MQDYKESSIKILEGLEAVRKRPGMYIGSTDSYGLHHLIWEIFDNSIDEVLAGNANLIKITLKKDNSIIIEDNGRGIPVGKHEKSGISTIDTVFTILHAGGKFDDSAYKTSGGLHGVGASVVNALSQWCVVTVKRNGQIWESKYENGGHIVQAAKNIGTTNRTGTTVHFKPDPTIFKITTFNPSIIKERVHESSFLFKGLKIIFENEITSTIDEFISKDGIIEYVNFINDGKSTINNVAYFYGTFDQIEAEIAFQYNTDVSEIIVSFANSVKTTEGGSHETAFKSALTENLNEYARKWGMLKEKDKNFEGNDVREGLSAVISVRIPEALIAYEGQTKNKLFTQEAHTAVKKVFDKHCSFWLEENKKDAIKIIEKAILARDARMAARKAREETRKLKNNSKITILSGKLTPAQSKNHEITELFLVEGDSAGGSAKLARDKKIQAILPLRGKVINVEKAALKDLLANEEIRTIISCLGAGIGNDFDIKELKYGKVIIMTDADTDGAHIQVLLLTFFYRYMKPLIDNKRIYIALPPLYKLTNNKTKEVFYAWNDNQLEELKNQNSNYEIQRYKGLGEMNADQLWETTMDPSKRQLIQVSINDAVLAERRVSTLMGENAASRKTWIDDNVDFSMEE